MKGYCLVCKRFRSDVSYERVAMVKGHGVNAGTCAACKKKAKP